MGDWWFIVFWILLFPLVIVEILIFLKSRKFYWLVYALSIFTYIVAVSYTIDVFDMGRNAIILTLLASAVLMFFIGRQLGKKVKPQKRVSRKEMYIAISLAAIMVIVFVVSVIFGRLQETVTPVESIKESDIVRTYEDQPKFEPQMAQVTVLKRTLSNTFILPVPVSQKNYLACIVTDQGVFNVEPYYERVTQDEEVGPGKTKTININIPPYYRTKEQEVDATAIRLYSTEDPYSSFPCDSLEQQPDYTIPIV
jgi:hypothetical protein